MEELKERKIIRLKNYDYNNAGIYFVTICTKDRQCILSRIVGTENANATEARVELSEYGKIAEKYIRQLNDFYDFLSVEKYVIMPNHIHFLLYVNQHNNENKAKDNCELELRHSARNANNTFSKFISTFKRFSNKECGQNIWQMRAYDHIIRDYKDYEEHFRYICENPINWHFDELYNRMP